MTSAVSRPRPSWYPDELEHAGRENLDEAHVARYDAKMDAHPAEEVGLLRELGLSDASVVIDLGAGTGQFTLAVAPYCRRVVAVDVSPVMLRRLQAKLAQRRFSNVDIVRAGFLTYEHDGEPVDFAYSRFALHHLPDFWKVIALKRLRRVMRTDGLVRLSDVVYNFEPAQVDNGIEEWCRNTAGDDVGSEWSRDELEEHVRDEHSTFTWLLEPMMERCGFSVERADYSTDGMLADYVLRARDN